MTVSNELIDRLLVDYKKPEDLIGEHGLLKQLTKKLIEREKYALATLPELAVKILDYVRDHDRATTRDMVRKTGASPNTLKAIFTSLVEKSLLARHGGGQSTWYSLPKSLITVSIVLKPIAVC